MEPEVNHFDGTINHDNDSTSDESSHYRSELEGSEMNPPEEVEEECPSPKCLPPPIPDRWEGEHIPKAYTLGYDVDLSLDDDMEYEDQSYIHDEIMRSAPQIPAPLPPSVPERMSEPSSTLSEPRSSPYDPNPNPSPYDPNPSQSLPQPPSTPPGLDTIPQKPTVAPPLPPVFDVSEDDSLANMSIDQVIGLAPEKEKSNSKSLIKKFQSSVGSKVKETTTAISRMLRRSSVEEDDFLGLQKEVESPRPEEPFPYDASMDFVHIDANAPSASNDDVSEIFGVVSFGDDVFEESESDPEDCEQPKKRKALSSESNKLEGLIRLLTISKQITTEEVTRVQEAARIDKQDTERILESYIDSGFTIEYNKLLGRISDVLPSNELRVKVLKVL